jgi:hypothetical protein
MPIEQLSANTCPHIGKLSGYVGYATTDGTPRFSCARCFGNSAVNLLRVYKPSEIVDNLYLDDADDATVRAVMTQLLSSIQSRCQVKKALTSDSRVTVVSKAQVRAEVEAIVRSRNLTNKGTK